MESIRIVFLFMAHMMCFSMFAWRSKPNTKGEKEKSVHASKAFTGLQMFFFLRPICSQFFKVSANFGAVFFVSWGMRHIIKDGLLLWGVGCFPA